MGEARDALLGKAVAYYAEHGVRDTSLRTLATAIGTSQRMLSYHFGSREDLLAAVIGAVVEADTATVSEIFTRHTDPFAAGQANWEQVSARARVFGALFFELSSHAMLRLPHAARLTDELVGRSEAAFAEAFVPHVIDPERARRLARLAVAVGRGLLFEALLDDDFDASDASMATFVRMLRAEIRAGSGAGVDGDAGRRRMSGLSPRPGRGAGGRSAPADSW